MSTETLSPELKRELQSQAVVTIHDDLSKRFASRREARSGNPGRELLEQVGFEPRQPAKLADFDVDLRRSSIQRRLPTEHPLTPADVIWVYSNPFDAPAQNSQCNGDPDQCLALADPANGEMNLALHIVNHSSDLWGFAGVGSWFVPRIALTSLVEFRTWQHWAYDYTLVAGALGEAAHSGGAFGARIFHWDAQGNDPQEMTDEQPLWAYGVDLWDDYHHDQNDGQASRSIRFPYDPGRHYLCVAYVFAACDAGGWPSSQATVDMLGELPFFVTEEWGMNF